MALELFQKKLCTKICNKLEKLNIDLDEKLIVVTAKSAIAEVMQLAQQIIQPDQPVLTEQEFIKVYKAICLTQDAEKVKKLVGESLFMEFQSKKPFYIERYKSTFYDILSDVQKELSDTPS